MNAIFTNKLDTVLIIDDEPFQTEWLTDYFTAIGLLVNHQQDLQKALEVLGTNRFRFVIIDLSIPFSPALAQPLASLGTEFFRYPGLMAARKARTTGHNTYQTIVYSVHDSDEVQGYADKIRCCYILKGRPRELKAHIDGHMGNTPHGWKSDPAPAIAKSPPPVRRTPPSTRQVTVVRKK
jgi:CheY-like chemotaxis protein